jgi:pyroglutamyl-peptidase
MDNPSWLAVKDLHNSILYVDPPAEPIAVEGEVAMRPPPPSYPPRPPLPPSRAPIGPDVDMDPASDPIPIEIDRDPRQIHITAHKVPVIYQTVLDDVPLIHTRPPSLHHTSEVIPQIPPPENGYDFVLHVGVAGRGPLRVERRGHKLGYLMKDINGELPPIVAKAELTDQEKVEQAMAQRHRAANNLEEKESRSVAEVPSRGFGIGYEKMPAELETDIDVPKLIRYLKEVGIDVRISIHLPQLRSHSGACRARFP